jgi:hypothetical protein
MGLVADRGLCLADPGRASAGYSFRLLSDPLKTRFCPAVLNIGTVTWLRDHLTMSEIWYRIAVIAMGASSIALTAVVLFHL